MYELYPLIILISFLLETMDSSAGMGFGTELTPLLFLLGYTSLKVVTILFLSEAITGCFVIIISMIFTYATFDLPTRISYIYDLS
ncbi:MAG: hypothetical protein KGY65_06805 [Candidatus Thermoplasmatota archaeon]|nr:hypothetical protein [Candidatus Thermoplasmatota archaeon]